MAQRQFRSDDTSYWADEYGSGSDGAWSPTTTTLTPIDSACSGTSGAFSLAATNASFAAGQLIFIHQTYGTGAGTWELNRIASYSAGTITLQYPLTADYGTGAQCQVMNKYSTINIASGQTITGKAWNTTTGGIIALMASISCTIAGTLTISGSNASNSSPNDNTPTSGGGFRGGNGWRSSSEPGRDGDGTVQLLTATNGGSIGNAGGGGRSSGGDSGGGGGGNGGAGSAGNSNSGTGGNGGSTAGSASLVTMVMGGGGGGGRTDDAQGGQGGSGGGIIFILAKAITVSGAVTANGGAGYSIDQASGGGGAGGSILYKGITIVLGSGLTTATGGAGGSTAQAGGAGGTGRVHADYASSISGTTNPTLDSRQDATLFGSGAAMFFS